MKFGIVKRTSVFPIAQDRPPVGDYRKYTEGEDVGAEVGEGAAFEVDAAHDLDEVAEGVSYCDGLCPVGHAADGGE